MKNIISGVLIMILTGGFVHSIQAVELKLGKVNLDVHGFLSQGYLKSDRNNFLADTEDGTFEFREYGLNISSYPAEKLYVGAQVFGRDFGDYGNNKPVLDWGLVDYRLQDWLGIRAGRMKIVHGLYNETRDIDMIRTSIFLPESIYNDAWRDSFTALDGVGLYGTLSLNALGSVSYRAQWGKIHIARDGGFSEYVIKFIPMDIDDVETSDIYVAGIEWNPAPPLDGLRLGWTWNTWEMDDKAVTNLTPFWQIQGVPPGIPLVFHAEFNITTLSAEYRWGNLLLSVETFYPLGYAFRLESPLLGPLDSGTDDPAGYYAGIAYRLTDWCELGMLYSAFYNNKNDKDGEQVYAETGRPRSDAWLKDAALTARFDIREHWVIKVEGHVMDGTDIMLTADNPEGVDQHWFLFACKVTYSF